MSATIATGHQGPRRLCVRLVGTRDLQTGGLGVQARQLQGRPLDRPAEHRPVAAVPTRGPSRITRPAQAVVLDMRGGHRALQEHLQVVAGQGLRHTGEGLLAGEEGSDQRRDALPHRDGMALGGGIRASRVSFTVSSRSLVPTRGRWSQRLTSTPAGLGVAADGIHASMTSCQVLTWLQEDRRIAPANCPRYENIIGSLT
jgi:hypothetical protein